jgi:hypothetical protein
MPDRPIDPGLPPFHPFTSMLHYLGFHPRDNGPAKVAPRMIATTPREKSSTLFRD